MKDFNVADWLDKIKDMPDVPPCLKCGRVIYCGVNTLCKEKECPKKTKGKESK